MSSTKRWMFVSVSLISVAICNQALAQDNNNSKNNSNNGDVVIVTAQKREQKLQDVPMAITVAGSAQLERQQVVNVRDLDRVSPAVTFVDGAPGGGAGIRGIATQSFTPSAEASVGIVVDGVPQGNASTASLFDMERVEVLRGPQGTLFGQSASAGVINMVTKAPIFDTYYGRIHADYAGKDDLGSKYGEAVVQGVFNMPVTKNSALRVSAFYNRLDGVTSDKGIGGDTKDNQYGARARYLFKPSDDLTVNVIADYSKQKVDGLSVFTFRKAASADVIAALKACGITASDSNGIGCSTFANYAAYETKGLSLQIDKQAGDITFTSITSYRARREGPGSLDIVALKNTATTNVFPQLHQVETKDATQASQEFRLTSAIHEKYDWVAGFYASYADASNIGPGLTIIPDRIAYIQQFANYHTTTKTVALYGQYNYNFTDKLKGLIGIRASSVRVGDDETFSKVLNLPFPPFAVDLDAAGPKNVSKSDVVSNLSGRIGAQYKISDDLMAYGTISRGFKAPQINDTVFGSTPAVVNPEIPTAFELGAKGMIGKVGIDANVFYTTVKDYQGQVCVFTPALTCGATNVSKVVSKGFELDLFGKPLPNLTLNGGFIYNPVTYPSKYLGSDGTQIGGSQMTGAPKYKLNLSGEYVVNFSDKVQGFVNLDTTYKSKTSMYPSASADYVLPDRWITGARIGVKLPQANLKVSLYARNIGNVSDPINIYPGPSTGDIQQIINKQSRRVVGISLDKTF